MMKFLSGLWAKWSELSAPVLDEVMAQHAPLPMPPLPAGEAQEPVNDTDVARTAAHMEVVHQAMDTLCLHANGYVVRDYGDGPVVEYDGRQIPVTDDQFALLEKMDVTCLARP